MKTMKMQRAIPLLLLAALTACSGSGSSSGSDVAFGVKAGTKPSPSVTLFDHLGEATITGSAEALVRGEDLTQRTALLDANFEDGSLGGLQIYTGFVTDPKAAELVKVKAGDEAFGGGKSVFLQGRGAAHGLSLRTGAIPVSPKRTYELSYHVSGEGVRAGNKDRYGGASVIMYSFPGLSPEQVAEALKDEAVEAKARLNKGKNPDSFWIPSRYGTTPWTLDEATFFLPPEATHMVVSFDLNRPEDDRDAHKAQGKIAFDDIRLTEVREPLHLRYQDVDDGFGAAHPLKVRLETAHPGSKKATEARYGIYAPAPSSLSFDLTVPQGGRLDFGYALLPEAADMKDGEVTFAVTVKGPDGVSQEVFSKGLDGDETGGWFDGRADLSAWGGKAVTLSLQTRGEAAGATSPLFALPAAAAVWGYPIVHSPLTPGRTVVLVAFDTLPAKRTSTFGYGVDTTPELSRIARDGVAFDRAASPAPWTLAGFGAMLTGIDPARHRAGERQYGTQSWRRPMADGFVTVAERLRAAGWETRAWINNPYLTKEFGLDQGFSDFIDVGTRSQMESSKPTIEAVLEHLKEPVGYDRFLFVHLMDPHGPYRPNDSFNAKYSKMKGYEGRYEKTMGGYDYLDLTQQKLAASDADKERIAELYHGVVGYADSLLGQIYDAARKVSAPDRFAFLVTSDHGEEMWEHDLYDHGHQMYDELLHVPLVVTIPGEVSPGRRVKEAVGSYDVAPTILTFAGIDVPRILNAQALQPFLKDASPPADRVLFGHQMLYGTQRVSVEKGGWKLLYNEANTDPPEGRSPRPKVRYELYDLNTDPGETKDLFAKEQKRALEMLPLLAEGFVRSLAGHYVVYVTGPKAPQISGELTLTGEASWMRFTKDMLWPLPSGKEGMLKFTNPRRPEGKSAAGFQMQTHQGIVAFLIDKGDSPVEVDLKVDGQPVPLSSIQVGRGQWTPEAMPFSPPPDQLALTPKELLAAAPGEELKVIVARLDETPELIGVTSDALSDEMRKQLEELGYIENH